MHTYQLQLLMIFLSASLSIAAQDSSFVKDNRLQSALHKAYNGKIVFTGNKIAPDVIAEKDFLRSYVFTPKSSLYLMAFQDRSLTNYLHELAPQLTAEELTRSGNYHFSFYVDNQLIYEEPLHIRAVYPESKNKETVLARSLTTRPSLDLWSEFMWQRFLKNGGDSVLTEGKHLFKMVIRPYIMNPELKTGKPIASGEVTLDVKKPKVDAASLSLNEVRPYNGLQVSQEAFNKLKIKELKAREAEDAFINISSVVVLKNSKILIEEYFNNADRNTLHDVRSVGKTFASTMAGIAINDGYLKNEHQRLKEFYNLKGFANYSDKKKKIQRSRTCLP